MVGCSACWNTFTVILDYLFSVEVPTSTYTTYQTCPEAMWEFNSMAGSDGSTFHILSTLSPHISVCSSLRCYSPTLRHGLSVNGASLSLPRRRVAV